jgi:hypothetical protein
MRQLDYHILSKTVQLQEQVQSRSASSPLLIVTINSSKDSPSCIFGLDSIVSMDGLGGTTETS